MKKIIKFLPHILLFFIIALVFKSWFMPGLITGGDFWPYSNLIYSSRSIIQYAWDPLGRNGMGGFTGPFLWIYINFGIPITILGKFLGLSWDIAERIYYLFPFVILSLFSSSFLFRKLISKNNFYILCCAVFLFNTYILMVIGGGQIAGIGIAYALFPLVLYASIKVIDLEKVTIETFKLTLISTLLLSIQSVFDIRIAYISLIAIFIYWIIKIIKNRNFKYLIQSFSFAFILPGIFSVLLQSFWIIPTVINGHNPVEELGNAYSSLNAVKFFSFAKFEDSIALLHPNWPENIFGKTSFLKPEFLILPILAFSSLVFLKKENGKRKMYVLFFSIIGLIGAFLAKGANDPFGNIYLWLFDHFPGFMMFRDPSKWYILVALSYSILIPYSILNIYEFIKSKKLFAALDKLFLIVLILFLLFLIKPAIAGNLNGLFKTTSVPIEYQKLEKFLYSDGSFYRTLWVPTQQRFSFFSATNPAIPAQTYFNLTNNKDIVEKIRKNENLLKSLGVKYIIVPYDSQGEIFLNDRKYDESVRTKTVKDLEGISWIKKVSGYNKIAIFQISAPLKRFTTNSDALGIKYKYINPTSYLLSVKNAQAGDLIVFSESFDNGWVANYNNYLTKSEAYGANLNSFRLENSGDYDINVDYYPQNYVEIGEIVSVISLIVILASLAFVLKKTKSQK